MQYEISNFAEPGYESRHNLKYWDCDEYLGIGPAAHSFIDGRRFFFPRDIESFIAVCEPTDDGEGGSFEEYLMLRLRLNNGLVFSEAEERFGHGVPEDMIKNALSFKIRSDGMRQRAHCADKAGFSRLKRGYIRTDIGSCKIVKSP